MTRLSKEGREQCHTLGQSDNDEDDNDDDNDVRPNEDDVGCVDGDNDVLSC